MSSDLSQTTGVILAGGLGTRLRAAVADRPKVLAEVNGRPFLAHLLDQMGAAGIRRAVLCTGYLGEQVEEAFGDTHGDIQLAYSREDAPLGTAGALRLALELMGSDPVLAINGDSYMDADLQAMADTHRASGANSTILLTEVPDVARYGKVLLDSGGALTSFEEKGGDRAPGWINAGLYLLSQEVLESIPTGRSVSLEKEILPSWIGRGLFGCQQRGRFIDIGTPESYAEAAAFFQGV